MRFEISAQFQSFLLSHRGCQHRRISTCCGGWASFPFFSSQGCCFQSRFYCFSPKHYNRSVTAPCTSSFTLSVLPSTFCQRELCILHLHHIFPFTSLHKSLHWWAIYRFKSHKLAFRTFRVLALPTFPLCQTLQMMHCAPSSHATL